MKLFIVLFLMLLVSCCQAKTLIVDPGESGDAKTLLAAIFLAGNGDTIQIQPGNYAGAIVDKSVNISGRGAVIVEGSLAVTAPGCRISDITIKASGKDAAVSLATPNNQLARCTVAGIATAVKSTGENNSIRDCRIDSPQGVEIFGAKNEVLGSIISGGTAIRINDTWECMISGCQITASQGVLIEDSRGNAVVNNTFSGNGFGVVLTRSHDNEVSHNNLSSGYVSGLDVIDSSRSNLTKNCITGGKVGISLRRSHSCNVSGNICEKNERAGIFAEGAYQNLLESNFLSENGNGILLQGSLENALSSNQAYRNIYGISLRGCTKNMLRGNILRENSYNLRIESASGRSGSSSHYFFVQDIDNSNLADNKPICYLVGKANLSVPTDCGFLGLVSCKNIRAANLTLKNSSTGVLLVNSTNCNIQNSSISWAETGFLLLDSLACTISRSRAMECKTGFAAVASSGCQFAHDMARNCSAEGIRADNAQGLGLLECVVLSCKSGVALHESRRCRIQNCSTGKNQVDGVQLSKSHNCSLIGNAAFSNDRGISLTSSNSCFLLANNASANKIDGISLQQLLDADVRSNIALRNGQGIFVQSSRRLSVRGNILAENSRFGLRMSSSKDSNITENNIYDNQIAGANLVDCTGNLLYHNIFAKNGIQNAADNGQNQWDAGPIAGGNFWSDHEVLGNPGDVPRQIPGGGVDRYPFHDPGGWQ
ncbi:MAG: right-handed parallel beta-helix repeat-containing protein [Methanothrix sp.]|nr:right-handed parallel beta-helix repeat-containing protein [Methanothrix sp.]